VAILDGVAGNPNNPMGTQVIWNKRDGLLLSSEAGFTPQGPDASDSDFTKYAVGSWLYTGEFEELQLDAGQTRRNSPRNWGFYGLLERAICTEGSAPSRNLRLFLRAGWANSHFNQFNSYIGSGFVYTGILPGRPNDRIGIAVAHARNGDPFLRRNPILSEPMDRFETVLEFTYEARVTPWLILHPDLQYVLNPGTRSEINNALVAGVRFDVAF
jgi:porin